MKNGLPKNGNRIGGPRGIPAATQQEQYLELSCNLAELKKIKECIFQIACKSNQEINKKIYLACEEIFVNIVSYSGADHARFFCSRNADKITVIFTDNGRLFNPLESRPEKDFNDFDEETVTNGINTRELILEILLEIEEEGRHSHIAIRNALSKYQFLPRQERAFITRVCEGTLEYRILIDYIIDSYSKVTVDKMKPAIREILRSGVYQIKFMDSVPDSAVCNEAVKLAQRKGFYNLKPFVNGVLRTIAREYKNLELPSREQDLVRFLSVKYSMPENLVNRWLEAYGEEKTEMILAEFLKEKPVTVRCRIHKYPQEEIYRSLTEQGVKVTPAPYLSYAYEISDYNHILALDAFIQGKIQVQDVSSMLVAEVADPKKGDYIIDMCAAPGGKSLHVGDKMGDYGTVDARDVSQQKVDLIEENINRLDSINVQARVMDATVFDVDSELKADIVLADVPCSGYGVIGKKPEIKYRVTPQKQEEIVILQRTILDRAAEYVKPGGVLVFSTCTIAKEENEENMMWFMNNHPFKLESLDPFLPQELHSETTALGYLQLLPGVHKTDGFFIAKFRRK